MQRSYPGFLVFPLAALSALATSRAHAQTICDFSPTSRLVVLNTDFTQVTTANCGVLNVTGGVFQFRNVRIPQGVTVSGTGSKPMIWIVTGDFVVEGELTVRGGNGARVDTL